MPANEFVDPLNWAADGFAFACTTENSGFDRIELKLSGELDLVAAERLARCLDQAVASVRSVVVDLREVSFMDSTGLGVLVKAQACARDSGSRLILVRGPQQVDRLLELTGLGDRFEVVERPPAEERSW